MNHSRFKLPLVSAASIRPPKNGHSPNDAGKLAKLEAAYERGERVRAVVVVVGIRDGVEHLIGLVGSHRIEAMRRVFHNTPVPDRHIILIDEDVLASALPVELATVLQRYVGDDEVARHEYELLLRTVAEASDVLADALGDQIC